MVPGGPWVLPGGFLVALGLKMNVLKSFGKGVFCPLAPRVLGAPSSIIVRNCTPSGARLGRKVLWDDDVAPFSSDKICEDFISGNHSHNLAPRRG